MHENPQFLKQFTKETDQKGRDELARTLREQRKEYFAMNEDRKVNHGEISLNIESDKNELEKNVLELETLTKELDELQKNGIARITNFLKIRAVRSRLQSLQEAQIGLESNVSKNTLDYNRLKSKIENREGNENIEETLNDYYEKQKERWEEAGFYKEKAKELFTEDHLASLSIEDYKLLMQRFSKQVMTHVFGFGVRDHSDMWEHTAGMGQYDDNVMRMFGDGRLRSSLSVALQEENKKEAIQRYFKCDQNTKKQASEMFNMFTESNVNSENAGSYPDMMAVHFAAQEVADSFYGGETGNEIFVVYPSELIASQYFFHGDTSGGNKDKYNDMWVWAQEERGVSLDAGVVFVPEDAMVDEKTGSKYKTNEHGEAIQNIELKNRIIGLTENESFKNNYSYYLNELGQLRSSESNRYIRTHAEEIKTKLGIDDELMTAVVSYQFLNNFSLFLKNDISDKDFAQSIDRQLMNSRKQFIQAEKTISSKAFWEKYFAEHPELKPSKIVFYRGGDPTEAVKQWMGKGKKEINLNHEFTENQVRKSSPQAVSGLERFKSLAQEAIDEYYDKK